MLPLNLYARVRFFVHIARETAGAARTRLSLRPLITEGERLPEKLARNARRDREGVFAHSENRIGNLFSSSRRPPGRHVSSRATPTASPHPRRSPSCRARGTP